MIIRQLYMKPFILQLQLFCNWNCYFCSLSYTKLLAKLVQFQEWLLEETNHQRPRVFSESQKALSGIWLTSHLAYPLTNTVLLVLWRGPRQSTSTCTNMFLLVYNQVKCQKGMVLNIYQFMLHLLWNWISIFCV